MPKLLEFTGTHPNLKTGKSYTVKEYAHHTGLKLKYLYSRFKNETKVTDCLITIQAPGVKASPRRGKLLGNDIERTSANWLRKTL